MERIPLSKNLFLDEYIPKAYYLKFIEHSVGVLFAMVDPRIVKADQMLRDKFGPVTINNWWEGGPRQWSGIRFKECPEYSETSQHSYGRASDKLFSDYTASEVRLYIEKFWRDLGITRIEDGVSWVHSDVAFTNVNYLIHVKP